MLNAQCCNPIKEAGVRVKSATKGLCALSEGDAQNGVLLIWGASWHLPWLNGVPEALTKKIWLKEWIKCREIEQARLWCITKYHEVPEATSKRHRALFREVRPGKGKLCPFLLFWTNMWLLTDGLMGQSTELWLVLIVLALEPIWFFFRKLWVGTKGAIRKTALRVWVR